MKKNLFMLFSIYFFVLQPLFIGTLRGQANFFRLGAINLVAIILIGMLSAAKEHSPETEKEHEKKATIKEPKVSFHDHFHTMHKEQKKRPELAMPFIVSFLVAIGIFFMFQYNSGAIEVMLVFALALGFIVFLSLTFIFKHRITKSFRSLLGTKIYLILLIISIALTAYDYYQVHNEFQASFSEYLAQNFLGQDIIPNDADIYTGVGTVIGTGLGEMTGTEQLSSDIFSGEEHTGMIEESTGTILGTSTDVIEEQGTTSNSLTSTGKQKIMDAVIYLIRENNVPLVTTPIITFTYVTTKNPYYAERRTAYANKLIGKTTNPSKYIVCESYIVMKGLIEKRPVTYTSSTVLTKFRDEAAKRDELNGCKKGYIVTDKTL